MWVSDWVGRYCDHAKRKNLGMKTGKATEIVESGDWRGEHVGIRARFWRERGRKDGSVQRIDSDEGKTSTHKRSDGIREEVGRFCLEKWDEKSERNILRNYWEREEVGEARESYYESRCLSWRDDREDKRKR